MTKPYRSVRSMCRGSKHFQRFATADQIAITVRRVDARNRREVLRGRSAATDTHRALGRRDASIRRSDPRRCAARPQRTVFERPVSVRDVIDLAFDGDHRVAESVELEQ